MWRTSLGVRFPSTSLMLIVTSSSLSGSLRVLPLWTMWWKLSSLDEVKQYNHPEAFC